MQQLLLVIDDNLAVRRALRHWITAQFPQCRVMTARTGASGFRAARTYGPLIVVIDVRLSCGNGIETARRIKARAPETAVVMFTFCDAEAYRTAAIRAGACGYVLKERAAQELLPLLGRLLDGRASHCRRGAAAHHVVTTESRQEKETRKTCRRKHT